MSATFKTLSIVFEIYNYTVHIFFRKHTLKLRALTDNDELFYFVNWNSRYKHVEISLFAMSGARCHSIC